MRFFRTHANAIPLKKQQRDGVKRGTGRGTGIPLFRHKTEDSASRPDKRSASGAFRRVALRLPGLQFGL
ncbi:hypothetical protein Y71_00025 [Kosakonia radicincitans DSM 16656]|nr:hypothetical protein A3780_24655 [Kosakonia radicincitans]ARD58375.1 hypothetical protein Y71_00025 [Kosakonia radicincitans DSM 16656]PTA90538.1 hypothetical protein CWM66_13145 [Kosakonia sp. H7A]